MFGIYKYTLLAITLAIFSSVSYAQSDETTNSSLRTQKVESNENASYANSENDNKETTAQSKEVVSNTVTAIEIGDQVQVTANSSQKGIPAQNNIEAQKGRKVLYVAPVGELYKDETRNGTLEKSTGY